MDNVDEQIGRFCPLAAVNPLRGSTVTAPQQSMYKTPDADVVNSPSRDDDYYWWASRVFDHVTVLSAGNDHLPLANPERYELVARYTPPDSPPSASGAIPSLPAAGVSNSDPTEPAYISYGRVVAVNATGNIEVSHNLSSIIGFYKNALVEFITGPAAGQCVSISIYDTSTANWTITPTVALATAPVADDLFRIIANPESPAPVQGLININTASWKVLSMLPLVRDVNGQVDNIAPNFRNDSMARAIVEYRNQYGPFKSIFDLNKVFDNNIGPLVLTPPTTPTAPTPPPVPLLPASTPKAGFQTGSADSAGPTPYIDFRANRTTEVDSRQGDYSPIDVTPVGATGNLTYPFPELSAAPPADGVAGDFEEKFLAMTRISNLITTRSDSFTCYVLVQGWRDAGTPKATLVAQRRAAFLIDRSNISQTNTTPNIANVPKQ
jgi:hypothetical protein